MALVVVGCVSPQNEADTQSSRDATEDHGGVVSTGEDVDPPLTFTADSVRDGCLGDPFSETAHRMISDLGLPNRKEEPSFDYDLTIGGNTTRCQIGGWADLDHALDGTRFIIEVLFIDSPQPRLNDLADEKARSRQGYNRWLGPDGMDWLHYDDPDYVVTHLRHTGEDFMMVRLTLTQGEDAGTARDSFHGTAAELSSFLAD